jgi:hypothetical protein
MAGLGTGILAEGSTSLRIERNRITDSASWGLAVTGGSNDIRVERNGIRRSGAFDLFWDQTGTGNAWIRNRCETSSPEGFCE